MAIQEKIWGLVGANGEFLESYSSRASARKAKKYCNTDEFYKEAYPQHIPTQIVQYKRWKKSS